MKKTESSIGVFLLEFFVCAFVYGIVRLIASRLSQAASFSDLMSAVRYGLGFGVSFALFTLLARWKNYPTRAIAAAYSFGVILGFTGGGMAAYLIAA